MVRITRGLLSWDFIDSFWLLRVSLAKIGEWKGLPKLPFDHVAASERVHLIQEDLDYNERDCRVLHSALLDFQEIILDKGGELGVTASSTSMGLFLRRYLTRSFLNPRDAQDFAQPGYVASRVERYREECQTARYYDLNSSFPFSMTFPCPGSPLGGRTRRLPTQGLWIADVTVRVDEDTYVPPVPARSEGRVFFPTGEFRATITQDDFACLGCNVTKVHEVQRFEERDDLKSFAEDMYKMRQLGGFEKEVWKIIGNGNYGKWAEGEEKEVLLMHPEKRDPDSQHMLIPGVFITTQTMQIPHRYVPISMMITARSRRLLHEGLTEANQQGRLYYCDTDSITCDGRLPTSPDLGGWKLEYEIQRGRFLGAKLYAIQHEPDDKGKTEKIKAKGFSRKVGEGGEREGLTYGDFLQMAEGRSVIVERMLRVRELMREEERGRNVLEDKDSWEVGSGYVPRAIEMEKRINLALTPKRCSLPDGDSRPWTWEELNGAHA